MARALALAWRGWGRVAPNPLVGAVVLRDGEVVGEGWHAEFGDRHAEPIALAEAAGRARGATLVVTLEPCAHQGKQPPCADAVLAAGVRRVVAALADPNPRAQGGAARLRAAGVEVELGLMAAEAGRQNAAFVHAHRDARRPFVALKLATSLDGRIADAHGRSRWVSGPEARAWVQWLRAGFDAIAVGAATACADDPSLTVRGEVTPRRAPLRVVVSRRGELPASLGLVRTAREAPTVVLATEAPSPAASGLAHHGVELLPAAGLAAGVEALRARGVESVLVEGGGRLAGALLEAGLVDRLYWIQAPLWLGERGVPAVAGHAGTPLAEATRWQVVERRALGEDTLLVVDRS
ncbi:MAG TPA: bifunctional diaminohydroxyphosphoribosylaminopyrimidine deaminase/5-amino-6-(5-phosphoribosylamino)uracil reductase RibD [Gemmatimonadales bacterium]|nr:bifunctional diaminohydroxyphosphoribosylaminopyrimidine deaminase/5-amino-6-(5-phosphoribosylamino)uracil reductase RibD [Gemmatimonadales bacterium]